MVSAKLHVICGNCGSAKDFDYKHDDVAPDADEKTLQSETSITCKNCSTIHSLNDNAENKNKITNKEDT